MLISIYIYTYIYIYQWNQFCRTRLHPSIAIPPFCWWFTVKFWTSDFDPCLIIPRCSTSRGNKLCCDQAHLGSTYIKKHRLCSNWLAQTHPKHGGYKSTIGIVKKLSYPNVRFLFAKSCDLYYRCSGPTKLHQAVAIIPARPTKAGVALEQEALPGLRIGVSKLRGTWRTHSTA